MTSVFVVKEIHDEHRVMGIFDSITTAIEYMEDLPDLYQIERRIVHEVVPAILPEDYRGGWIL